MSLPHVPGKRVECMNKHDKWEGRRGGGGGQKSSKNA